MQASLSAWAAVVAIGCWHGLNPAMGWPLAVARGLERRSGLALAGAWMALGAGHLLSIAVVLVPFAALAWLLQWRRELSVCAGVLVALFGLARWKGWKHPRWLARARPAQLATWSFLMATVHGAALMLLPVLLSLCGPQGLGDAHAAAGDLMRNGPAVAAAVSLVHTLAMAASGLVVAWVVYRWLGLRFLRSAWLDLEKAWAAGLVLSGLAALVP